MTCDGFVDKLLRKMLRNVTIMGLSEDGVGPEILFQNRFPVKIVANWALLHFWVNSHLQVLMVQA